MTIAPPSRQPLLLHIAPSWRITKNAQARNAYGSVAQELVCAALGITPVPINGNYECCFDAHHDEHGWVEIKSVKRTGGKVVIYDWRMAKEQASGVVLHYAILCHNVKGSDGRQLVREFVEGGLELIVLPAEQVHALAAAQPLQKLMRAERSGVRCGYNRKGYKDGYRNVPVSALRALCGQVRHLHFQYVGHDVHASLATMADTQFTLQPGQAWA